MKRTIYCTCIHHTMYYASSCRLLYYHCIVTVAVMYIALHYVFWWSLGRFLWVDLIKLASMSVRPSICQSTKSFSDSSDIWCVGRGRWVMHDSMPYGPIQGQGHMALKVRNSFIFKSLFSAIFNSWARPHVAQLIAGPRSAAGAAHLLIARLVPHPR